MDNFELGLTQIMREAGEPLPGWDDAQRSRFRAARRRWRARRGMAWALGSTMVAVAAVGLAGTLTGGPRAADDVGTAAVVAPSSGASARSDSALIAAVTKDLPAGAGRLISAHGEPGVFWLVDHRGTRTTVQVTATVNLPPVSQPTYTCAGIRSKDGGWDRTLSCEHFTVPGGDGVELANTGGGPSLVVHSAAYARPYQGGFLVVTVENCNTGVKVCDAGFGPNQPWPTPTIKEPPLTPAQLKIIALDPAVVQAAVKETTPVTVHRPTFFHS